MSDLITIGKAESIKLLCNRLFGFVPTVTYYDDHAEIFFDLSQQIIVRNYLEKLMNDKIPSDLRINIFPILLPLVIKKFFPYGLGIGAIGFFIGKK